MTGGEERWALILHGGAKTIAPEQEGANRNGCLAALAAGEKVLRGGGSALDAAEQAVRVLEDDPTFNAGFGSVLNAAGEVEMDAAIMDGATLDIGGVAAAKGVRHPVTVARLMLREKPILLVGEGARQFAMTRGAELCDPAAMIATQAAHPTSGAGHDTVGCVALDMRGNLAACTSTGGLEGCAIGRVGDSPMPGCGFYADNRVGAIALSGDGEQIARVLLAGSALALVDQHGPQQAIEQSLMRLRRTGGEAGAVLIDRHGRIGWAHNSQHFAVAYVAREMSQPRCFLAKSRERDFAARA